MSSTSLPLALLWESLTLSSWAVTHTFLNSTPDLRNRFVVGATSTYAVGATGGSADAIVVSHTHTITDPGHAHSYQLATTLIPNSGDATNCLTQTTASTTGTASTGISINTTGSSGTNANLPPYYALCYIMKA